jgi:hypothetical protein
MWYFTQFYAYSNWICIYGKVFALIAPAIESESAIHNPYANLDLNVLSIAGKITDYNFLSVKLPPTPEGSPAPEEYTPEEWEDTPPLQRDGKPSIDDCYHDNLEKIENMNRGSNGPVRCDISGAGSADRPHYVKDTDDVTYFCQSCHAVICKDCKTE